MKKIILTVMTLLIMTCIQGCSYSEIFYREYNHTKMSKEQKIEKLANVMGETYDDKFQFVGFPTYGDYAVYQSEKYPDSYVFANVYDKKDGFGYIYTDNYLFVKEAEELKDKFKKQVEGTISSNYTLVSETEKMLYTGIEGKELPEKYYKGYIKTYYLFMVFLQGKNAINDAITINTILEDDTFSKSEFFFDVYIVPEYVEDINDYYIQRKLKRHYISGNTNYYIGVPDKQDAVFISDGVIDSDEKYRVLYFCNPIEGMETYLSDKYGVEFKYVEDSFVRGEIEDKAQFINSQDDEIITVNVLNVYSYDYPDNLYYAHEFSDDYKSTSTNQ